MKFGKNNLVLQLFRTGVRQETLDKQAVHTQLRDRCHSLHLWLVLKLYLQAQWVTGIYCSRHCRCGEKQHLPQRSSRTKKQDQWSPDGKRRNGWRKSEFVFTIIVCVTRGNNPHLLLSAWLFSTGPYLGKAWLQRVPGARNFVCFKNKNFLFLTWITLFKTNKNQMSAWTLSCRHFVQQVIQVWF